MRTWFTIFAILVFLPAVSVYPAGIYSLIQEGRIAEARDSLSSLSTASTRGGNRLFYQALLERDAREAAALLEAALNASVDADYRQEIHLRLAQYYYLAHRLDKLQKVIIDYKVTWPDGEYTDLMIRYSVLVDQEAGQYESALRQVDQYLLQHTADDDAQWGQLDKARVLRRHGKEIGADKLLRELSRAKSGPGVAPALYLLTIDAVKNRNSDDAVFYYNLLREGYPAAIGLNALVDRMAVLSSDFGQDREADRLTGTFYSVQVGVFADHGNAKDMAGRFKKHGYEVDIRDKRISNVTYNVVYVGRFPSFNEAAACKTRLEAEHQEAFQVVAR